MTRRALVTGGNRGIGKATAQALHEAGFDVVIGARDGAAGQAAADEIGCASLLLDVADRASIAAAPGDFDVLINNAGVLWNDALFDDPARFDASIDVMIRGPYDVMRHCLPHMKEQGYGRVVNISSGWGSFAEGLGGGGAYGAAKTGLNGLTVIADRDTPDFIKINAMCPGWVRTRMGGPTATTSPEEAAETALWLATLPEDGPSGGFFRRKAPIQW